MTSKQWNRTSHKNSSIAVSCFTNVTDSAPSKESLHWAHVCFSAHAIVQLFGHTTSKAFQTVWGPCDILHIYEIWNVANARDWHFTAQMVGWHCAIARLRGNTGHRPITRPVSPLHTRLIYVNPSEWTIYCSFEVIFESPYLGIQIQCSMQWRLICRHCGSAAPPIFTVNFVFRSIYCVTLIFKSALTKRVDNVSSGDSKEGTGRAMRPQIFGWLPQFCA